MMENINILKMATAMARHAADRHQMLSENIANADTPGYKAKEIEPFAQAYSRMSKHENSLSEMLNKSGEKFSWRVETINKPGTTSPNGNNVSIEDQMMRSIEAQQDHLAATAIYKKSISLLRTSLGRGA